ncbi:MAG: PIN domain-containing protein [Prosthecobacter sp.]
MTPARTNYIFVDYENVQDIDLKLIQNKLHVKVVLVVGRHQQKVPMDLLEECLKAKGQVDLIRTDCTGKNALDLVLAYHVGLQAAEDASAFFHILSKDKAFDALVNYLKTRNVLAARDEVFAKIPTLMDARTLSPKERLERVTERLNKIKSDEKDGRPKTLKRLQAMIMALFFKQLSEADVAALVAALRKSKWVDISTDEKVSYKL